MVCAWHFRYTCGLSFRHQLARKTRLALHLFRGRWFTLIPFHNPITVVVGTPIEVGEPVAEPSEQQVAELHATYCDRLHDLYYSHRSEFGYDDVELQFM